MRYLPRKTPRRARTTHASIRPWVRSGVTAPASLSVEHTRLDAGVDGRVKSDPDGQPQRGSVLCPEVGGPSLRSTGVGRLPQHASASAAGLVLAAGCLLILAGCGGQSLYSAAKTRPCLASENTRIDSKLNFVAGSVGRHPVVAPDVVASTATGGAFVANLPDNTVTISFGATLADAANIAAAYQRFALPNVRANIQDVLERYQNAVLLWHQHPSSSDLALVTGCFK